MQSLSITVELEIQHEQTGTTVWTRIFITPAFQRCGRSNRKMRTNIAIRMIAAKIRIKSDPAIGRRGFCLFGGTGGSSIPTAVVFRGGPPAREEDACGSGSGSHSVNS